MHMFRNWISGMGRGFSTAARTALVALGPRRAVEGAGVPKAGPGRLGAARRGGGRFHAMPRRSDCWQGACLWARAAGRSARL